jgi:DNA-binding response OmpR family regulator
MNILLIEPDILAGKLYADAISKNTNDVKIALDAQSALHALDEISFECIVLELDLITHNGFEFIYEFCSQDDWKNIPIIIHSRINPEKFSNMLTRWDELNVIDFLYKPASTLKDLQVAVEAALVNSI